MSGCLGVQFSFYTVTHGAHCSTAGYVADAGREPLKSGSSARDLIFGDFAPVHWRVLAGTLVTCILSAEPDTKGTTVRPQDIYSLDQTYGVGARDAILISIRAL